MAKINRTDIILVGLLQIGGDKAYINMYDLAVYLWKQNPGTFSIPGYKEHPDPNIVRSTLSILKSKGSKTGDPLVEQLDTKKTVSFRLTQKGIEVAKKSSSVVSKAVEVSVITGEQRLNSCTTVSTDKIAESYVRRIAAVRDSLGVSAMAFFRVFGIQNTTSKQDYEKKKASMMTALKQTAHQTELDYLIQLDAAFGSNYSGSLSNRPQETL